MSVNGRLGKITADQLQDAATDLGDADIGINLSNTHSGRVTNLAIDGTMSAARFTGLADAQSLVTASDTTTTLDGTYASDLLITGSGVLQWYDLGTATAYANGKRFTVFNGSTEIVGVKNSNNTVWERVPPRWGITCILRDKSTAAGVWDVFWHPNPLAKNGGLQVTDFGGVSAAGSPYHYYSEMGWQGEVVGGSGSTNQATGDDQSSSIGTVRTVTGAAGTGHLMYNNRRKTLGGGPRSITHRLSVINANSLVQEFVPRIGLHDNIAGGAPTNGCIFYLDVNAYGNVWVCRTVSAAGNNTTATAVTPGVDPTYDVLKMEVSSAAARVDYWINKALVATHSTAANIPTGVQLPHNFGLVKVAGANARTMLTDYVVSGFYPTVQR